MEETEKFQKRYKLIPIPETIRDEIYEIVETGRYVSVSEFVRSACRQALLIEKEEHSKNE